VIADVGFYVTGMASGGFIKERFWMSVLVIKERANDCYQVRLFS